MDKREVKLKEKCNDEACSLLDNVKFKNAESEIEAIELVSGLLEEIALTKKKESKKKLYSDAEDLIVEKLFRFFDLKPNTREAIIQAMIEFRMRSQPQTKLNEWVSVDEKLPKPNDEDYLVVVKNKNKEGGIFIFDVANFSSDGIWKKSNTWEKVTHWRPLPSEPPKEKK